MSDELTVEEQDLIIGAIPLQALPDNWYVGDCAKCHAMVVDCCNQCERCRDHCDCWGDSTSRAFKQSQEQER